MKPVGWVVSFEAIRDATKSSIDLAIKHSCSSIVFPAFWTGSWKIPFSVSAEAMRQGFERSEFFMDKNIFDNISILLVLPDKESLSDFNEIFGEFLVKTV